MLHVIKTRRSYDPETVMVMTAAFDRASQCVSPAIKENDELKRMLALIIIEHVDKGERDPIRLADVAIREWTGTDSPRTGALARG